VDCRERPSHNMLQNPRPWLGAAVARGGAVLILARKSLGMEGDRGELTTRQRRWHGGHRGSPWHIAPPHELTLPHRELFDLASSAGPLLFRFYRR
jgi:hypothetical protein